MNPPLKTRLINQPFAATRATAITPRACVPAPRGTRARRVTERLARGLQLARL